jgi:5-dehydro-2-deoxygluconokinase
VSFELLTMGRIGVDLYPEQIGVPLEQVRTFRKMLGGTATNVAVAAARLGRRTAVITKVGDDPFGGYIRGALTEFGVDARFVGTDPSLRTPLAFCEIHPPDDFPLLFYREPSAPDLQLAVGDLDRDAVRDAGILWVTGTGLSVEPSRSTTLEALTWRSGETVVDLDWRPTLWGVRPLESGSLKGSDPARGRPRSWRSGVRPPGRRRRPRERGLPRAPRGRRGRPRRPPRRRPGRPGGTGGRRRV